VYDAFYYPIHQQTSAPVERVDLTENSVDSRSVGVFVASNQPESVSSVDNYYSSKSSKRHYSSMTTLYQQEEDSKVAVVDNFVDDPTKTLT